MTMTNDFWRGKRVLLTGHTGFKGAWLCIWLRKLGATVIGFALEPPASPNLFEIAGAGDDIISNIGDIRDPALVRSVICESGPEIVIHMAAQSLVAYSYDNPLETYQTNILGTANVLDAVRHAPTVRTVLSVTSDKCYENKEWTWGYREIDPMGGYDPYSSSKGCAELVTSAYRRSYFSNNEDSSADVALASARAGNVIGGGDWADNRLIPDILKALQNKETINIRSPNAVRPWQHVLEPLSGYLELCERLHVEGQKYAGGWNFGPHETDTKPVAWIADRLVGMWEGEADWKVQSTSKIHEAGYLKLDCSKAHQLLDWHPQWSLDQALQRIVSWHKAWLNGEDMHAHCLADISEFEQSKCMD